MNKCVFPFVILRNGCLYLKFSLRFCLAQELGFGGNLTFLQVLIEESLSSFVGNRFLGMWRDSRYQFEAHLPLDKRHYHKVMSKTEFSYRQYLSISDGMVIISYSCSIFVHNSFVLLVFKFCKKKSAKTSKTIRRYVQHYAKYNVATICTNLKIVSWLKYG